MSRERGRRMGEQSFVLALGVFSFGFLASALLGSFGLIIPLFSSSSSSSSILLRGLPGLGVGTTVSFGHVRFSRIGLWALATCFLNAVVSRGWPSNGICIVSTCI